MAASNPQDYLVTGFTGGFDRPTQREDYIVHAASKAAAIARFKISVPTAKRITARATSEFKELNVYALFSTLK